MFYLHISYFALHCIILHLKCKWLLVHCLKSDHLHCNNRISHQLTADNSYKLLLKLNTAHIPLGINLHTAHNPTLGPFRIRQTLNKQPNLTRRDTKAWQILNKQPNLTRRNMKVKPVGVETHSDAPKFSFSPFALPKCREWHSTLSTK